MKTLQSIEAVAAGSRDEQYVYVLSGYNDPKRPYWVRFAMEGIVAVHFQKLLAEGETSAAAIRLYTERVKTIPLPTGPNAGQSVFFWSGEGPREGEIGLFVQLDELARLIRNRGDAPVPDEEAFAAFEALRP